MNLREQQLWKLCQEGIPEAYPVGFMAEANAALNNEFEVVCRLGQVEELLAAAEIRQFIEDRGIPFRLILAGCSSIIAQLLGLTDVNPIFLGLHSGRFRDSQGRWAPIFHINVPQEHRQTVLDFANERYGQEFIAGKIRFLSMSALERVPYLVTHLIRKELNPAFRLRSIWKERDFQEDPQVFQMLCEGNTEGIFWLEGVEPDFLKSLNPGSLENLTDFLNLCVLDINHPEILDAYVEQKCERAFPGARLLSISSIISVTNGLILYREQIMSLLGLLGRKWFEDSYEFIRAASRKHHHVVAEYRNRFLAEAPKICHLSDEEAIGLFDRIQEAASYSPCKATCAADAMTIYQAGYLKYHYPDLFQRVLQEVRDGTQGESNG